MWGSTVINFSRELYFNKFTYLIGSVIWVCVKNQYKFRYKPRGIWYTMFWFFKAVPGLKLQESRKYLRIIKILSNSSPLYLIRQSLMRSDTVEQDWYNHCVSEDLFYEPMLWWGKVNTADLKVTVNHGSFLNKILNGLLSCDFFWLS